MLLCMIGVYKKKSIHGIWLQVQLNVHKFVILRYVHIRVTQEMELKTLNIRSENLSKRRNIIPVTYSSSNFFV